MTPEVPDIDEVSEQNAAELFDLVWARGLQEKEFQRLENQRGLLLQFYVEGYKSGARVGAAAALALARGTEKGGAE